MSRRRDRPQRNLRGPPVVEPRRRILVVCEGTVTEPTYLRLFASSRRNPAVEVVVEGVAHDPVTLVDKATERRDDARRRASSEGDENLAWDEVWCCFDVDAFGPGKIAAARDAACGRGLKLAMSNPCFELWLVLHLRDSPGAQNRHAMQKLYGTLQPTVREKHVDFGAIAPAYETAFNRARVLHHDAKRAGEEHRNPTTEVYLLTDAIDAEGRERRHEDEHRRRNAWRGPADAREQAAWTQARHEGWDDPSGDEGGDA